MALEETLSRILHGHFNQLALVASLGIKDGNFFPFAFPQILLSRLAVVQRHRQQDLIGNESVSLVELRKQRTHDFIIGKLKVFQRVGLISGQLPLSNQQHLHFDETAFPIEPENILVDAPVRNHTLFFQGFLDRLNLIANLRRRFELQRRRFLLHFLFQLGDQLLLLPFDKQHRSSHLLPILVRRDGQDTGRQAALDLVLKTRPAAIPEVVVRTVSQQEVLLDDIDGFPRRDGGRKRAEITIAVFHDLTRGEDSRPRVLGCDFDAQITFVVLQPDVVSRLILFDEIVFENQSFFIAAGNQGFNVFDAAKQKLNLRTLVRVVEVNAHAGTEIFGLADVHDFFALVPHQVDAGARRKVGELFCQRNHRPIPVGAVG